MISPPAFSAPSTVSWRAGEAEAARDLPRVVEA